MKRTPARELFPRAPEGLAAAVLHEEPGHAVKARLWAGGDLGFSGHLRQRIVGTSVESPGPLEEILQLAEPRDLWFANLETPILEDPGEGDLFAAPPEAAAAFGGGRRWILNVANNHVRDYGGEGLTSTLEALRQAGAQVVGVSAVGAGNPEVRIPAETGREKAPGPETGPERGPETGSEPELEPVTGQGQEQVREPDIVVTEVGGLRLGWLAAARTLQEQPSPGPRFRELDGARLVADVKRCRSQMDLLAVSLHLGYMYVDVPHPEHRSLALELAEAGADLVLCHHAHVLQGLEAAPGGAWICHGLGNLLFDWTEGEVPVDLMEEEQRSSVVLVFDLGAGGVQRLVALPVRVDDAWTLRWARGEAGERILGRLEGINAVLAAGDGSAEALFWRQRSERNTGHSLRSVGRLLRRGDVAGLFQLARRLRPHHLGMAARWLGGGLRERRS